MIGKSLSMAMLLMISSMTMGLGGDSFVGSAEAQDSGVWTTLADIDGTPTADGQPSGKIEPFYNPRVTATENGVGYTIVISGVTIHDSALRGDISVSLGYGGQISGEDGFCRDANADLTEYLEGDSLIFDVAATGTGFACTGSWNDGKSEWVHVAISEALGGDEEFQHMYASNPAGMLLGGGDGFVAEWSLNPLAITDAAVFIAAQGGDVTMDATIYLDGVPAADTEVLLQGSTPLCDDLTVPHCSIELAKAFTDGTGVAHFEFNIQGAMEERGIDPLDDIFNGMDLFIMPTDGTPRSSHYFIPKNALISQGFVHEADSFEENDGLENQARAMTPVFFVDGGGMADGFIAFTEFTNEVTADVPTGIAPITVVADDHIELTATVYKRGATSYEPVDQLTAPQTMSALLQWADPATIDGSSDCSTDIGYSVDPGLCTVNLGIITEGAQDGVYSWSRPAADILPTDAPDWGYSVLISYNDGNGNFLTSHHFTGTNAIGHAEQEDIALADQVEGATPVVPPFTPLFFVESGLGALDQPRWDAQNQKYGSAWRVSDGLKPGASLELGVSEASAPTTNGQSTVSLYVGDLGLDIASLQNASQTIFLPADAPCPDGQQQPQLHLIIADAQGNSLDPAEMNGLVDACAKRDQWQYVDFLSAASYNWDNQIFLTAQALHDRISVDHLGYEIQTIRFTLHDQDGLGSNNGIQLDDFTINEYRLREPGQEYCIMEAGAAREACQSVFDAPTTAAQPLVGSDGFVAFTNFTGGVSTETSTILVGDEVQFHAKVFKADPLFQEFTGPVYNAKDLSVILQWAATDCGTDSVVTDTDQVTMGALPAVLKLCKKNLRQPDGYNADMGWTWTIDTHDLPVNAPNGFDFIVVHDIDGPDHANSHHFLPKSQLPANANAAPYADAMEGPAQNEYQPFTTVFVAPESFEDEEDHAVYINPVHGDIAGVHHDYEHVITLQHSGGTDPTYDFWVYSHDLPAFGKTEPTSAPEPADDVESDFFVRDNHPDNRTGFGVGSADDQVNGAPPNPALDHTRDEFKIINLTDLLAAGGDASAAAAAFACDNGCIQYAAGGTVAVPASEVTSNGVVVLWAKMMAPNGSLVEGFYNFVNADFEGYMTFASKLDDIPTPLIMQGDLLRPEDADFSGVFDVPITTAIAVVPDLETGDVSVHVPGVFPRTVDGEIDWRDSPAYAYLFIGKAPTSGLRNDEYVGELLGGDGSYCHFNDVHQGRIKVDATGYGINLTFPAENCTGTMGPSTWAHFTIDDGAATPNGHMYATNPLAGAPIKALGFNEDANPDGFTAGIAFENAGEFTPGVFVVPDDSGNFRVQATPFVFNDPEYEAQTDGKIFLRVAALNETGHVLDSEKLTFDDRDEGVYTFTVNVDDLPVPAPGGYDFFVNQYEEVGSNSSHHFLVKEALVELGEYGLADRMDNSYTMPAGPFSRAITPVFIVDGEAGYEPLNHPELIIKGGDLTVDEGGVTDTYQIKLRNPLAEPTVIQIAARCGVTVDNELVTVTADDFTQVTVTARDDAAYEGPHSGYLRHYTTQGAAMGSALEVSIGDNDAGKILMSGCADLNEGTNPDFGYATTGDLSYVLTVKPKAPVVLKLGVTGQQAVLSKDRLVFDFLNWQTPQTVRLTTVNDAIVEGRHLASVTATLTSADPAYSGVSHDKTATLVIQDNDDPGVTLSKLTANLEEGDSASGNAVSYTIRFQKAPKDPVTINMVSSDLDNLTVSPASYTFTKSNYAVEKTVTVRSVGDQIDTLAGEGTENFQVRHTATGFLDLAIPSFTATVAEDDVAGLELISEAIEVQENGTAAYSVRLASEPRGDVIVNATSSNDSEATVSGNLTFGPSNWTVAQTFTVTGRTEDDATAGDVQLSITHVLSSDDDAFYNLAGDVVPAMLVTVVDNDVAGVTFTAIGSEYEENENFTYSVRLNTQPTAPVTLTIADGADFHVVGDREFTFTSVNYADAQDVTINVTDDAIVEGAHAASIVHELASNHEECVLLIFGCEQVTDESDYDGLTQSLTFNILDNDAAGVTVTPALEPMVVDEQDGASFFDIALNAEPGSDVTISVGSDDGQLVFGDENGQGYAATRELVFTAGAGGLTPVTVSVKGTPDFRIEGDHVDSITFSISGGGAEYESLLIPDQIVTITDDDEATIEVVPVPDDVLAIMVQEDMADRDQSSEYDLLDDPVGWTRELGYVVMTEMLSVLQLDDTPLTGLADFVDPREERTDLMFVSLGAQPLNTVTIDITSPDGQVVFEPSTLTFDFDSFQDAQQVTVKAVDDDKGEFLHHEGIILLTSKSNDADFEGLTETLTADVEDNDDESIVISVETLDITEGTNATYTVALESLPASTVYVNLTTDATQQTVAPSELVFTPEDGMDARTITVTPIDDAVNETDAMAVDIAHAVESADELFAELAANNVTVTVHDDDIAGIQLTPVSASIWENATGNQVVYQVNLTSQPVEDIVVNVTVDTADLTLDKDQLTFDGTNWDTAQTVTATAVDDDLGEGLEIVNITHTVYEGSDDYLSLPGALVAVTIADDDLRNLTVSSETLSILEGNSKIYEIALASIPADDVTVTIDALEEGEIGLETTTYTFTTDNWNVAQEVNVTAIADQVNETSEFVLLAHTLTSDDSLFNDVEGPVVNVTILDGDEAAIHVLESGGTTNLTETPEYNGRDYYNLALEAKPTDDVVITATAPAGIRFYEEDVDPADYPDEKDFTFTPENFDEEQDVVLVALDDEIARGNREVNVTHTVAGAAEYASLDIANVTVGILDDDEAGITITPLQATVQEAGQETTSYSGLVCADRDIEENPLQVAVDVTIDALDLVISGEDPCATHTHQSNKTTYVVALETEPVDGVTVELVTGEGLELSATQLQFNASNWQGLVVTATAVNDDLVLGNRSVNITHSVTGGDLDYQVLELDNVTIHIVEDDAADVVVIDRSLNVTEGGAGDIVSLRLTSMPTADVRITFGSADGEIAAGGPITFTAENWDTAQDVTVNATDDDASEGNHEDNLTFAVSSADDDYDGLAVVPITVAIADNDVPGLNITGTPVQVSEDGATDSFNVTLQTQPAADVTVALSGTGVDLDETTLTFTVTGWNVVQAVTVTARDDEYAQGTHSGVVSFTIESDDDLYNETSVADLPVSILDDDAASIDVSLDQISVTEGGTAAGYTVALGSMPTDNVTVNVTGDSRLEFTPSQLAFNASNWGDGLTVSVVAPDDGIAHGTYWSLVRHEAFAGASEYVGLVNETLNVTVTDTDTPGVVITEIDGTAAEQESPGFLDVEEPAPEVDNGSYSIRLATQPSGDVTIELRHAEGQIELDPASVTFTADNYDDEQIIVITAVDDDYAEGNHTADVAHTITGAAEYAAMALANVTFAISDNDEAGLVIDQPDRTVLQEGGQTEGYSNLADIPRDLAYTLIAQAFEVFGWLDDDVGADGTSESVRDSWTFVFDQPTEYREDQYGVELSSKPLTTVTVHIYADEQVEVTHRNLTWEPLGTPARETVDGNLNDVGLSRQLRDSGRDPVATLVFTPDNWDQQQRVYVRAIDDDVAEGDHLGRVAHEVVSEDSQYNGASVADIEVDIIDNDEAGLKVQAPDELLEGTSGSVTVAATSEPSEPVTVAIALDELSSTVSSVELNATNWFLGVTIEVTAIDDGTGEGTHDGWINLTAGGASEYIGLQSNTSLDVEEPNREVRIDRIVSITDGVLLEGGGSASYEVYLDTQPTENVVVSPVFDSSELNVTPAFLTFTADNWDEPQQFTVHALDDESTELIQYVNVSHTATGAGYENGDHDKAYFYVLDSAPTMADAYEVADETCNLPGPIRVCQSKTGDYYLLLPMGATKLPVEEDLP